jgi:hypothetical protein
MPLSKIDEAGLASSAQFTGFKNRIINGDMRIDQRNAGASVTNTAGVTYTLDRWASFGSQASKFTVQQNAGSVTPPAGFKNYLGVTSLSAYSVGASEGFWIRQPIEGFNIADFGWGAADAPTVTVSFWVRSSLTGTFGGSIVDNFTPYSYPFSYTISAANTWEQKTITIVGPTSGSFPSNNTVGLYLIFSLGAGSTLSGTAGSWQSANLQNVTGGNSVVGTNGATFYITGVQLEKGSTATSFDYRPYGTELQLCQRYYQRIGGNDSNTMLCSGLAYNTTTHILAQKFTTTMRASPTGSVTSGTAFGILVAGSALATSSVSVYTGGIDSTRLDVVTSSTTSNGGSVLYPNASNTAILLSAEL